MGRRHTPFFLLLLLLLHLFSTTSLTLPPKRPRQNRADLRPPDITVSAPGNWSTANTTVMITNITTGWSLQPLLLQSTSGPTFACSLLSLRRNDAVNTTDPCNSSRILFGIFLVLGTGNNSIATNSSPPEVVWVANRSSRISHPATLSFTETDLLQLDSGDGSSVWRRENVANINLTYQGRLKLSYSSRSGSPVEWPSLDYPTNTALLGQSLSGKQLVANASEEDPSEGQYLLNVTDNAFTAYVQKPDFWPPQIYYSSDANTISNGTFLPDIHLKASDYPTMFVRLDIDGHLRFYMWSVQNLLWKPDDEWRWMEDDYRGPCMYPMKCGEYGYCTSGQCSSCPRLQETNFSYFQYKNFDITKEGCEGKTPLQSCHPDPGQQQLFYYGDIAFYGYAGPADIQHTDVDNCR